MRLRASWVLLGVLACACAGMLWMLSNRRAATEAVSDLATDPLGEESRLDAWRLAAEETRIETRVSAEPAAARSAREPGSPAPSELLALIEELRAMAHANGECVLLGLAPSLAREIARLAASEPRDGASILSRELADRASSPQFRAAIALAAGMSSIPELEQPLIACCSRVDENLVVRSGAALGLSPVCRAEPCLYEVTQFTRWDALDTLCAFDVALARSSDDSRSATRIAALSALAGSAEESQLRAIAILGLGGWLDSSAPVRAAFRIWLHEHAGGPLHWKAAVFAVAHSRDPQLRQALLQLARSLGATALERQRRFDVLLALARYGLDSDVLGDLMAYLSDPGESSGSRGFLALELRRWLSEGQGPEREALRREIRDHLTGLVLSDSPYLARAAAIASLASMRVEGALEIVKSAATSDPEAKLRGAAVQFITEAAGDPELARALLTSALGTESDSGVRVKILKELAKLESEPGWSLIAVASTQDSSEEVRQAAAVLLAKRAGK